MIQYVIFKHPFDYCGYMCSDFQNLENVVFVEPYSFGGGHSMEKDVQSSPRDNREN